MKSAILCLLALVAACTAISSLTYDKIDLGAALRSKIALQGFLGRADNCTGLCIIHFEDPDGCGVGVVSDPCAEDQVSVGVFADGCHCCIPQPEVEE